MAHLSTFELSRYRGAGLAMIDRHYGLLARDGREHAIKLLDTYRVAERLGVHAVDTGRTSTTASDANGDNGKAAEQARS